MAALDGKVCVVTGAAGVIGRESVDVFTRAGAIVVGVDVKGRGDDVDAPLFLTADLTDPVQVEAVYRAALGLDDTLPRANQHPANVWSLHGYHECLVRLGKTEQARIFRQQLDLAAAQADIPVNASCACRLGVMPRRSSAPLASAEIRSGTQFS